MADDARFRESPAELRGDIDAGRTGDKSGGLDPAAAPLGTDAEAAASVGELGADRAARPSATQNAVQPELAPDARMSASGPVLMGFAIGFVAAIVFAAFLWVGAR